MGMLLLLIPLAAVMAPFMLVFEGAGLILSPFADVFGMWVDYFEKLI